MNAQYSDLKIGYAMRVGVDVEGSDVNVVQLHAIKNDILLLCALCDTLPSHYEHVTNMFIV